MLKSTKIYLFLFLLLLSQNIFGLDKYFIWVDPQTKLRARIDVNTLDLVTEYGVGFWHNEGKIKLAPETFNRLPKDFNNAYFTLDNGKRVLFSIYGTGQVYEFYPQTKELKRIDNTFHSGYNFTSNKFIRNGILYSIGGEGFWSYNSTITYFDEKLKEWEIIRPKNKGPLAITNGYQGYFSKQDIYYSGGSQYDDYLEKNESNYLTDLFVYDFKKNEWQVLGELNKELSKIKNFQIFWTGKLFLHFFNKSIYIIDPEKNEVHLYENNSQDLDIGVKQYVYQDTLVLFQNKNGGPIQKFSISEMQKKAVYFGKFYTTGLSWYWYYIGLFVIIISITILKWKRKEAIDVDELSLSNLERKLLNKLISLEPNEYLSTYDLNEILGATEKSQENQRKIRYNVINQINKKLKAKFNFECAIERKALPEDKRLTVYKLDPVVLAELKRLM